MPSPDKKVAVAEAPDDPYAAEATAVLVAKSALSAAKDELRLLEHRTQVLLAPPEEPFKPGAAPPAKGGAKPGAAPPVDAAHEAQVAEAQAAVADAKQRVQALKEEHAAAEGALRRRRLVQLAEKLQEETNAQKASFREALRETSAELTEEAPKRAAAIAEERRRDAALRRVRTRQDEAEYRRMIDPELKRDQDALLVGPDAKFVAADFDDRQVGNFLAAPWPCRIFPPPPRALAPGFKYGPPPTALPAGVQLHDIAKYRLADVAIIDMPADAAAAAAAVTAARYGAAAPAARAAIVEEAGGLSQRGPAPPWGPRKVQVQHIGLADPNLPPRPASARARPGGGPAAAAEKTRGRQAGDGSRPTSGVISSGRTSSASSRAGSGGISSGRSGGTKGAHGDASAGEAAAGYEAVYLVRYCSTETTIERSKPMWVTQDQLAPRPKGVPKCGSMAADQWRRAWPHGKPFAPVAQLPPPPPPPTAARRASPRRPPAASSQASSQASPPTAAPADFVLAPAERGVDDPPAEAPPRPAT